MKKKERVPEPNPTSLVKNAVSKLQISERYHTAIKNQLFYAKYRAVNSNTPFLPVFTFDHLSKLFDENKVNPKYEIRCLSDELPNGKVVDKISDWRNNLWRHLKMVFQEIEELRERKQNEYDYLAADDDTDEDPLT